MRFPLNSIKKGQVLDTIERIRPIYDERIERKGVVERIVSVVVFQSYYRNDRIRRIAVFQ